MDLRFWCPFLYIMGMGIRLGFPAGLMGGVLL